MKSLLSFVFLFWAIVLSGQSEQPYPSIADRYPGGADTLRKFLATNARYPESAINNPISGLSISSVTISPNGIIDKVSIHNSLGKDIDSTVVHLLYMTEGHWIPSNEYNKKQSFYCQLSFVFDPAEKENQFTLHGDSILEAIYISILGFNYADNENSRGLKRTLNRLIDNGEYNEALEISEELIRRDPFNVRYHELQAKCFEGLGYSEQKTDIIRRIEAYNKHNALFILPSPVLYGNIKIIKELKNGTYSIKELTRDSSIIYSGKLASIYPRIRQGKYYFFSEEGKIKATGTYQNDIPVGSWQYFNNEGIVVRSLDYTSVVKFLMEEQNHPLVDSAYMGSDDPAINSDGSFSIAEKMPKFDKKDPATSFSDYIIKQLHYPQYPKIKGLEGKVIVQFTIDKEGYVRNPVVVKGAHMDLNMEALRIIINSPQWTPGKVDGNFVNVVFSFPVYFRLQETFFGIEFLSNSL